MLSFIPPRCYRVLLGVFVAKLVLGCAQPQPQMTSAAASQASRPAGESPAASQPRRGWVSERPIELSPPYALARLHRQRGDLKGALEIVRDELRQHPDTYRQADAALDGDADARTVAGLVETARDLSERLSEDVPARYLYGRLLAKVGQDDSAAEQLATAVRLDRRFGPSSAALAELHVNRKEWKPAIEAADAALAAGLHDAKLYMLAGRAHDAVDEMEEAESAWMKAFAEDPKSGDGLYLLAESLERRGRRQQCEELYRRILDQVDQRHVGAREKLFLIYLNSDRLDKAKECFAGFGELGITGAVVDRCRAMLNLSTSELPEGRQRLAKYQEELSEVVEEYPQDADTRIALAMSYLAVSDFPSALKWTDQVLAIEPHNVRAREFKALLEARMLRFKSAAAVMEDLLKDRPHDTGYMEKLLEAARFGADYDTAARTLRGLLAVESGADRRKFRMAQLLDALIAAGRFDDAVKSAEEWLAEDPSDAVRRDAYLTTLTRAGRKDKAVEVMGRYLKEDPTGARLRARYIAQLQAAGRYIEGQQQVLAWLANDPDDVELNRLLISLLWANKQWDSAIEVAQTGTELAENRNAYEGLLGQSYVLAGRFDQAVEFYRGRANRLQTEGAYRELLGVLVRADRLADAEQLINRLLAPDLERQEAGRRYNAALVVSLRRQLASIYELMDRRDQAVQQLEAIYQTAPDDPGVNNDLGYTYADAGVKLDEAERMVRLALTQQPEEPAFLDSLGWVMYKRGRFDEAVYYLRLANRKSDVEDAPLLDHLGDALYRDGRKDEARESWEKAVKLIDPDRQPPPPTEDRRLRERVQAKLKSLAAGETPEVAALAEPEAAAQPAATQP